MVRISLRQEALEVKPQDIITRDNVTLKVNAVIFLRVIDPRQAVVEVSDSIHQTSQFAQTTLRSVLGEVELDELLARREKINMRLQSILDTQTVPWGAKVMNVEVNRWTCRGLCCAPWPSKQKRSAKSGPRSSMLRANTPRHSG
jgi:regulator of protease activity HflC (stomatin/prohibitin superfamily)